MKTLVFDVANSRMCIYWCLLSVYFMEHFLEANSHTSNDILLKSNVGENCELLLERFASITANFTRCAIRYARPIMICQKCINEFNDVKKSHDNILKLQEDSGEACQKELLNVDRLDLIGNNFQFVNEQWKKAACEKCFIMEKNSTLINESTVRIFQIHNNTEACFQTYKKHNLSSLCADCKNVYCELNNFYIEHGSHREFCMDVINMMNNTRYEWSKTYNCSSIHDESNFLFFTSSVIVCMLPIIFYFFIWLFSTFSFPEISTQNRWNGRFSRLNSCQDDS